MHSWTQSCEPATLKHGMPYPVKTPSDPRTVVPTTSGMPLQQIQQLLQVQSTVGQV